MSAAPIEPGLLRVFRWFVGIRLVLLALGVYAARQDPNAALPRADNVGIFFTLVLFGLLMVPAVQGWMGRALLPVTLTIASIAPIVEHAATAGLRLERGFGPNDALADYWQLFFLLFVPLILIAWQYRYRAVLLFAAVTTFLDAASLGPLLDTDDVRLGILGAIAIGRGVLFAFVGAFVAKLVGAQKEARRALAHHASTLEELATSRERNRLARELHDTLAHGISGVAVQLEAVDALWDEQPEQARAMLRSALEGARGGLAEARRAISSLRAGPLEESGLIGALESLAEEAQARSDVTVEIELMPAVGRLAPDLEQVVYRVADEAMTNVLRHAEAGLVQLRLLRDGAAVHLVVNDDGRGFDVAAARPDGHVGLIGMRERAELVGGELVVESEPGEGTRVELVIDAPLVGAQVVGST